MYLCFSDHSALESIRTFVDHNACVQRWLDFLTALYHILQHRKGGADGNNVFLSRLPEPATEHDRRWSRTPTLVEDAGIFLNQACGLLTRSSTTPRVGLGGLVRCPNDPGFGWDTFDVIGFFPIFERTGHV